MGASLIDIKKRIESTKMTRQITSAMQMVSASKMNRSEQQLKNYLIYSKKLEEIVMHLAGQVKEDNKHLQESDSVASMNNFIDFHDMLIDRPVKKTGYIVISSDQGLAGNYNSSIFQSTLNMLQSEHKSNDEFVLLAIGSAAKTFFKKHGIDVAYQLDNINDNPTFEDVRSLVVKSVEMFREGVFDALYVCYNHHVNAMMSMYRAEQMLPLVEIDLDEPIETNHAMYIFEPSIEEVLAKLLPQYAESMIYGIVIDAKTAEHASRMVAMRSATDNATKLIDELKKLYNQKRQTAITQEITEIVGGSAALLVED